MSIKVVIVDYGMGNLNSVQKKLKRLNILAIISSDPRVIESSDKIILPGVGHFKKAMANLKKHELSDVLNEQVLVKQKPILGICLGMQLMGNYSEEGEVNGLGWIDAAVKRFQVHNKLRYKVPHMGWNQILMKKESSLMRSIPDFSEFYFVHAYQMENKDEKDILSQTEYENTFTSAIEKENIFGVQYHPEKSHDIGDFIFKNFIAL